MSLQTSVEVVPRLCKRLTPICGKALVYAGTTALGGLISMNCNTIVKPHSTQKRQHGFSLVEVMVVVGIMALVGLGVATLMTNTNRQQQSITAASDFSTLVNTIQGILNNSGSCLQSFGGAAAPQLTIPWVAPIPVTLTMGGGGATINGVANCSANLAACQKYGNNLAITTFAITAISNQLDSGAANQYIATLTLTADRSTGKLNAVGGNSLTKAFTMVVTVDPANANKITNCSGQNTDFWTAGTVANTITYMGGFVGIGTVTPAQTLDVNGTVQAQAFLYTSDARLKENVREIPNALERALKLRGVLFDWKNNKSVPKGTDQLGFIAQEVEAIFPEAVTTHPETGMKSVAYGNLVAPLFEALKQQQDLILQQQQEIDEIKGILLKNHVK
jgi:prepilin-type N-terminal cleavage/methylation domain-containing protein